jgi:hypothetical protein
MCSLQNSALALQTNVLFVKKQCAYLYQLQNNMPDLYPLFLEFYPYISALQMKGR